MNNETIGVSSYGTLEQVPFWSSNNNFFSSLRSLLFSLQPIGALARAPFAPNPGDATE